MKTKKQVNIVLFVEHVARELDIACVIKFLMGERHGLSLEIASLVYDLPETIKKYQAPTLVITPYCYSALEVGVYDLLRAWPHASFVNLAWEQIFQKINQTFKAPYDDFARRHVLHIVWSDLVKEYLVEYGTLRENIVVNGNPNLALYESPYCHYFDTRKKLAETFKIDPDKRWVFIPENYGAAFYNRERLRNYSRRGVSRTAAYSYRKFALASLEKVIQWLKQAAVQEDTEIIVRPRPATPEAKFRALFLEAGGPLPKRLHILKGGTVREWIMASDIVASSYSTTLIEAAVARRPVFMLAPIPFPDFLYNNLYELVPKIEDFSDLISVVKGQSRVDSWRPLREWAVSTMLGSGDPIVNLTDLLNSIYRKKGPVPLSIYNDSATKPLLNPTVGYRARRQLAFLARKTLLRLPGSGSKQFISYECDEFNELDLTFRLGLWKQVLNPQGRGTDSTFAL